jgi:hypothetical protein
MNSNRLLSQRPRSMRSLAVTAAGIAMLVGATPASALLINVTFGTTGGAAAFTQAQKDDINAAVAVYQSTFTDAVTMNITVNNMNSGLGQSSTFFTTSTYGTVHAKLIADATTADDTAALAQLLSGPAIADATAIDVNTANARAMGINANPPTDSTIGLNASLCFETHNSAVSGKYDLYGVFCHELDEAMGTTSGLFPGGAGNLNVADLYRYNGSSGGVLSGGRSYTNSNTAHAFFSIDGVNALDEYNQNGNANGGDFGDWIQHSPGQVQDWAGTTGQIMNPNVEFRLLDVVGWNRSVVPEPSTFAVFGLGLVAILKRRKKK